MQTLNKVKPVHSPHKNGYDPQTGEWTWGYLRLDVRRVLSTLQNQLSTDDGLAHS